jgi:DNA-binding NtrC family response regulator/tetratricopeptide (TPR) repeat protein
MSLQPPGFEFAVSQGRFKDAFAALVPHRDEPGCDQSLIAELLQFLGRSQDAEKIAARLLEDEGAELAVRARATSVLANLFLERREIENAATMFQRAAALASDAQADRLACSVRQLLLSVIADSASPDAVATLTSELRRSVLNLGDESLLAAFHVRLARIEAQRGSLDVAGHHLHRARSLLDLRENHYIRAQLELVASGLSALMTDYPAAAKHATVALDEAVTAGHRQTELGAKSNMALFQLRAGNLREAERILRDVVPSDFSKTKYIGPLDNLAQLLLLRGNLKKCEAVLAEIHRRASQHSDAWTSWEELEALETFARLSMAKLDWSAACSECDRAIDLAGSRNDRLLETSFRIRKAECLLRARNVVGAAEEATAVAEKNFAHPPGLLAEIHRVTGLILNVGNQTLAGVSRVRRAVRIATVLGPVFTKIDAIRDDAELDQHSDNVLSSQLENPITLDAVAAMLDLSSHPELLGREAFALLEATGACSAIALVARRPRRAPDVLACRGWDPARAAAAARASGPHAIVPLGQRADRAFELVVEPARDLLSRCTVVAVRKVIAAALALEAYRRDERQRASLWPADELDPDAEEIVAAAPMLDTLATARKIAPLDIPVLITGETGTGKEMLARAIHRVSPRAGRPFLPFNCTALPREMVESQLFGYRRGAFTGAQDAFPGVIRAAAGGTLFLDEIGELPAEVQPKLLRFLDTHEIHPLGEAHPLHVDVRVIAATNANLDQMVSQGRFREDLYYRLNVIRFRLPPLRERREEIPPLARHFLRRAADEFRKGQLSLSDETMEDLLLYGWPGNVRQLANEIRRMAALADSEGTLESSALSPEVLASRRIVRADRPASDEVVVRVDQPLGEAIALIERLMVRRALERAEGRVETAARMLGISRKGLFLKRRRLGVQHARPS